MPTQEDLRYIVDLDVRSEATDEQMKMLEEDLFLWKDELAALIRDIDNQLTARKSSVREGLESADLYESWKRGAVKYRSCVESRLHDVKAMIRKEQPNTLNKNELAEIRDILSQILVEIRKKTS